MRVLAVFRFVSPDYVTSNPGPDSLNCPNKYWVAKHHYRELLPDCVYCVGFT
jgi:hypothetical protein